MNQRVEFNNFVQRLKKLGNDEKKIPTVCSMIDELQSVDYQDVKVNAEVVQDVLMEILKLVPNGNNHILSKFCHILQSFVRKSKIVLQDKFLDIMVDFLMNSFHCGPLVLPDVLYALSALLYGNVGRLERLHEQLASPTGILLPKALGESDINVQLAALKCLQSLTFRNQSEVYLHHHHLLDIYAVCLSCMKANAPAINNHMNCKVVLTSLKCLQHIFAPKIIPKDNLGELLGLLKAFLYCGFPGQASVIPTCLYPALMSMHTPSDPKTSDDTSNYNKAHFAKQKVNKNRSRKPNAKKKNKEKEKRRSDDDSDGNSDGSSHKTLPSYQCNSHQSNASEQGDWWRTSSSDSDFSDVDDHSAKLKSLQTSIRQHAYCTLHAVVKAAEKKIMFGYWSSFLPDSSSAVGSNQLNIFTTILKDPSPQVRFCAVSVFTDMMRGSKQFLSLVDDRTPNRTSFITASSVLTTMVNEFHRCLLLALISESSSSLIIQILKCYAMLADVVPYHRLSVDLLLKLLKHLKTLLLHKDLQVQVACLTVYGSLLNSDQVPDKVLEQIMDVKSNEANKECKAHYKCSSNDNLPWIMDVCKDNLLTERNTPPLPIQVESLQVCRIVSGRYFAAVRPHLLLMEKIILRSLQDEQPSLQLHGAKFLEVIGRGILNDVNNDSTPGLSIDSEDLDIIFNFWNNLCIGPFPSFLFKGEQPTLRSVCCDCLSTIPSKVFERLSKQTQIFFMTMMFGLSIDTEHNIRGAAVRCLGIYSLFPSLREDLSFLSDVGRILTEAVTDDNVIVRAKASWAMGNLSDALFLSREEYPDFASQVNIPFFCSIGMASVKASEDCDRVKANAVRVLGNLLHYVPPHFLDNEDIQEFVRKSEASLLAALSAKFMKVCWNACYAFGNTFKNCDLVNSGILNLEEILQKLMSMLYSINSKVRINAILALSALPSRDLYGKLFVPVCNEFIMALSTADSGVDFKELKHFESLCDTLCFGLCHLLCLADAEDFREICRNSVEAGEIFLTSMWKFGLRISKEKFDVVCSAYEHIEDLAKVKSNSTIMQSLELWRDILNQTKVAYYQR